MTEHASIHIPAEPAGAELAGAIESIAIHLDSSGPGRNCSDLVTRLPAEFPRLEGPIARLRRERSRVGRELQRVRARVRFATEEMRRLADEVRSLAADVRRIEEEERSVLRAAYSQDVGVMD